MPITGEYSDSDLVQFFFAFRSASVSAILFPKHARNGQKGFRGIRGENKCLKFNDK
ncbi:hypothetical protein MTR_7g079610 [Medicago truncatula]|uniref:Uncharacterized protein n=1 Tax=Medicago truncatula TaxID=3880 RepID=G7KQM5_MEDTR|nr:hypothetical protein MTR_7g079610 [Medicago truncatula]